MSKKSASKNVQTGHDLIKNLSELVPCRKQQIEILLSLIGESDQICVPSIFLYGHTATGKSLVLHNILKLLKAKYAVVNCIECYTSRLMYEHILNALTDTRPAPSNNYANYARCDNTNDFVRVLRQVIHDQGLQDETVYLIFENAERLRDVDSSMLPSLLRLQELSGCNVTVVMESDIVWEKFRAGTGSIEPFVLFFPDYSKDEMLEILSLESPPEYSPELYNNYLNLLLSVFHYACRSLTELHYLATLNFPKYVEPIKSNEASATDLRKLWRNIEPHLKKALQTVYLREVSSSQWERLQDESIAQGTSIAVHGMSSRLDLELPYYSKYLLIAAYLASYNPAKTDKRFFAKHSGKINKKSQIMSQKRTNERTSTQLLGPKPFPLDRLMAIFYSIAEGKVGPSADIFCQVRSLVSLGLLGQPSSADPLEIPKYKCLVSLDFIKGIARTVRFEVIRYLYDFV